jgi:hypothetical protein
MGGEIERGRGSYQQGRVGYPEFSVVGGCGSGVHR